jgi:ATP-dependent Lon protease
MEIIRIAGYTELEKLNIAKRYLIKKQREANGLAEHNIEFADASVLSIIRHYTKEAGVRNLEREIASVCRKAAVEVVKKDRNAKVKVTPKSLTKLLGPPRYRYGKADEEQKVGVATGLAWTDLGGELLGTEVTVMPGKGKLIITGKLGDVMQESAQAAMSYVRSKATEFNIPKNFNRTTDVHIHIPEGAIPKDGPSAGITLASALVSALGRIELRKDVAMTGEITLRGKVLPIGGVKEKVLAAHRAGLKNIILPKDNEKDLADIPKNVLDTLDIYMVETMDDVLKVALARPLGTIPATTTAADAPVQPAITDDTITH